MPDFGNSERICIPGAFGFNALAKTYIISNNRDLSEHIRQEIIERFNPGRYTAPFSFELVENAGMIPNQAVADAVKQKDYLAIVQVPDTEDPIFIACQNCGELFQNFLSVVNLILAAENEFKTSFQDIVLDYAQALPSKAKDILHIVVGNVYPTAAISGLTAMPSPTKRPISFGCNTGTKTRNQKIAAEMLEEARKDFVDNVLKYQSGDANALSKIELVIKSMSDSEKNKILSDYIKAMAEDGVNTFHKKYIDTGSILESSKVSVWVRRCNTCSGNDGYFRIYYKYGDDDLGQFGFKHKESCVIFLMHLLYNRQNGDIRKNLVLDSNNQESFVHIFMNVYDITKEDAIGRYLNLQDDYDEVSNKLVAQGRLKDFISDCNKSVDDCITPLGESAYPLKIKRNGYMPVLNSNVHFDEDSLRELQTTIV